MEISVEIISKQEALLINQKWFFTGIECSNNHIAKRYTKTMVCYKCKSEQNKRNRLNNPIKAKEIAKRTYVLNKEKRLLSSKNWCKNNRNKSNEIKKQWKLRNHEKVREYNSNYNKRKRKDPYFRLSKNVSKSIWECLKGNKNHISWLNYVDYSLDDLVKHLESKFKKEMNWDNYGSYWHLDHIKPLSWFDLENEFKEAWSLSNLQPLEAKVNCSKSNRYEG